MRLMFWQEVKRNLKSPFVLLPYCFKKTKMSKASNKLFKLTCEWAIHVFLILWWKAKYAKQVDLFRERRKWRYHVPENDAGKPKSRTVMEVFCPNTQSKQIMMRKLLLSVWNYLHSSTFKLLAKYWRCWTMWIDIKYTVRYAALKVWKSKCWFKRILCSCIQKISKQHFCLEQHSGSKTKKACSPE